MGTALERYGFGRAHPLSTQRLTAFQVAMQQTGLEPNVMLCEPVQAEMATIEYFHSHGYVEYVKQQSILGEGYLDYGDTPAFLGMYEAAATVVGCAVAATEQILSGVCKRAFVPIGGLHHARRTRAAGFCVFNDCGVVIEILRNRHHIRRIVYVDIDAHHGDGVFYAFETDPDLWIVDFHEDGRYLYPGTGALEETGKEAAVGTKLNIPLPPYASDEAFQQAWPFAEQLIEKAVPEFIIFQCGADSLAGDPITHLAYSREAHAYAATRLCALADKYCDGRILALGGGGYNLDNLGLAWTAVVEAFINS